MLQLFSSGLMTLWLEMAGMKPANFNATEMLAWRGVPLFVVPDGEDPAAMTTVQKYLKGLPTKGMVTSAQGIWMQSGPALLTNHQGTVALPAASLTKTATTLAALKTWGPNHRFETLVSAAGQVKNGVLNGDLVITGGGDPLFVWEEAIALGNSLNKLGIRRVTGNLIINGNFYMNYHLHPRDAGDLLKLGLNTAGKSAALENFRIPKGTPLPSVQIAGDVRVVGEDGFSLKANPKQTLLVRHQSMTLTQIVKEMNIYSNNEMAQMLANSLGGASVVSQLVVKSTGIPEQEIHLVNGSGLGVENRLSPHAVCVIMMAIQRYLQPHHLTIADLFPVSGHDHRGTVELHHIPTATVIKTGTLDNVSALAGVMPTRDRGLVWFAIINRGDDIDEFRHHQDQLLQQLSQRWGVKSTPPVAIAPTTNTTYTSLPLGEASRNQSSRFGN